jgi:hypothetical protein
VRGTKWQVVDLLSYHTVCSIRRNINEFPLLWGYQPPGNIIIGVSQVLSTVGFGSMHGQEFVHLQEYEKLTTLTNNYVIKNIHLRSICLHIIAPTNETRNFDEKNHT